MGSESSYKNESYTVSNQGLESVKNEIKHNHPSHNIKLYECDYSIVLEYNFYLFEIL